MSPTLIKWYIASVEVVNPYKKMYRCKIFLADTILSPEASNSSATFSLSFPGEDSAFQLTLFQVGGRVNLVDLQLASQRHHQGLIDQKLLDELLTFLDVSGRARLNALAGSSDTSSWLRAPPIASLGLQICRYLPVTFI